MQMDAAAGFSVVQALKEREDLPGDRGNSLVQRHSRELAAQSPKPDVVGQSAQSL
ncbi:MAG: hypothetical protein R3C01_03650 [Planctomycetaceae bacterium]